MATIFLQATSDVELAPNLTYYPLSTPQYPGPFWQLITTDVATKGLKTDYAPFVAVRVGTASMPPASAVASITVIADYTVAGGGGVVYRDATVSIDTSGERHYKDIGGLFLTFGDGARPTGGGSISSLQEFTEASGSIAEITNTTTFPSTLSSFNSVRFYVAGVVDMFLTSSNAAAAAAEIWEINPCPVSAFALPDHGGKTFGYVDFMIQFNDILYICATSTDDTTYAVFTTTDGVTATWVRDLTGGRASAVAVNTEGTVLYVFNGTKVESVDTVGTWLSAVTGITDINPNTVVAGYDYTATAGNKIFFATFRMSGAHVPNIYTWNGTVLGTIAPATTGIENDDKVVVSSIFSTYYGDLVYVWAWKFESWSDAWFDAIYVGMRNTTSPASLGGAVTTYYPQMQTLPVSVGKTGFYATDLSNPMAAPTVIPYNYTGPGGEYLALAVQYYTELGAIVDPAVIFDTAQASYPFTFTLTDPGLVTTDVPQAFDATPSLSYADATGIISWVLTTIPCTGAPWTDTDVNAIESVGFHLESFVGDTLILNRLGIEVDYTPIPPTRNNKGCLAFLVS